MANASGRPGPVRLGEGAHVACRPLGHDAVRLRPEGWLGSSQAVSRTATIQHCVRQLADTGALETSDGRPAFLELNFLRQGLMSGAVKG